MPRALTYTPRARHDLEAISDWLMQAGSGSRARRRPAAIWGAIERLHEHPCRYPVGQHRRVRELSCDGGYRALYRVYPDTGYDETAGDVRVLRVFGPGQSRDRL